MLQPSIETRYFFFFILPVAFLHAVSFLSLMFTYKFSFTCRLSHVQLPLKCKYQWAQTDVLYKFSLSLSVILFCLLLMAV